MISALAAYLIALVLNVVFHCGIPFSLLCINFTENRFFSDLICNSVKQIEFELDRKSVV